MSNPFQITLDFSDLINFTAGSLMMVEVEITELPSGADQNEQVVMGLAFALVAHLKQMTEGPPDEIRDAFLNLMKGVWRDSPTPISVDLTTSQVADA